MSSLSGVASQKKYWRSLSELENTPEFEEFLHREFPVAASEYPQGVSRRRWLQIMGASLALSSAVGCRWEREIISPFVDRPEGRIPGVPQKFATALELGGVAQGLVVTCYDGRPIKVEGNREHPASLGATDVFAQGCILNLWDPDRAAGVRSADSGESQGSDWSKFDDAVSPLFKRLKETKGAGLAVLCEQSSSLTLLDMKRRWMEAFPESTWVDYASIPRESERAGAELAFGQAVRTNLDLKAANVVVCLDSDLLASHPQSVRHIRDYSSRRNPEQGKMNRLYAIESQLTVTGAAADHRLAMRSGELASFLSALETAVKSELEHPTAAAVAHADHGPQDHDHKDADHKDEKHKGGEHGGDGAKPALPKKGSKEYVALMVKAIAQDLVAHQGAGIIAVGPQQSAAVHARVHRLNALLGNAGKTVTYTAEPFGGPNAGMAAVKALAADLNGGKVNTLLILGGNPAYDLPGDLQFAEAIAKAKTSIHLGEYDDETSQVCAWHLPKAHAFEAWGDARSYDGTITLAQPLIEPLHGGRSSVELLAVLLGEDVRKGEALVRRALESVLPKGGSAEDGWRKAVHDGLIADSGLERLSVELKGADEEEAATPAEPSDGTLEVVFRASPSLYDGRFANNGWLQELPEFMTKVVWDNVAVIAPATAEVLKVKTESLITLQAGGKELTLPVFVLPGQAAGSIGVYLGYGRTAAGHVGGSVAAKVPTVGVNANALRTTETLDVVMGVTASVVPGKVLISTTQDHHSIDKVALEGIAERVGDLIREGDLATFEAHPDFAQHQVHHPPLESLWKEVSYENNAWGMAIDLSKCVGCNACVVACQAENNVPIVGKEQVARGREMHWIRLDRYFKGEDIDQPEVATQPVTCQQCENAPCEQVCPVAATVHSHEGLNDMVYNRCIGTRYCGNNCPYKVRRFNYFDWNKKYAEPENKLYTLGLNPDVTVRMRGVMEKCTYCVQRIQGAKIVAKNERRTVADGEIVTACQQACPAEAIVFGDLNQEGSRVAQLHKSPRSYGMLAELNTKPRTQYLARIRNPHPLLAEAKSSHQNHEQHHA